VLVRGVDCEGLVGEAILESQEAHDVLIRSDFCLLCRGPFSHGCVLWEKDKTMRSMGPKVDNVYIVGMGLLVLKHRYKIL